MGLRDKIFGNPKITVSTATGGFIMVMLDRTETAWPVLKRTIVGFGKPFNPSESPAKFNLFLAGVGLHLNSVHNLFPDQANEIETEIYRILKTDSHGDCPGEEIRHYRTLLAKQFDDPRDAHAEVAVHLLREWMDGDISDFVGQFNMIDPLTLMAIMSALVELGGGYWKTIKETRRVVSG